MDLSIIAAIGENRELGKNNGLIWRFPEDMAFFKETTMGHPIVMGRNTFESLPRVLPGRKNIIISSSTILNDAIETYKSIQKFLKLNDKIEIYKSIEEFLKSYEKCKDEIFIIGGASIYGQFIDLANQLYLTEIAAGDKSADVYFPEFNKEDFDCEINGEYKYNSINYRRVLYKRR